MRSLPRWNSRRQPADGIAPYATGAPQRVPVARHLTEDLNISEFVPRELPGEDPNLLTAYPAHGFLSALALAAVLQRPPCRILAVSRDETAARLGFEFEVVVGQNLAMLADQDHPVSF